MANRKITQLPASSGEALTNLAAIVNDPSGTPVTQKATLQQIFDIDPWFKKIGTAFVGGIQTGNARGLEAIDIVSRRDLPNSVASGDYSIAIGVDNVVSGEDALGIGANTDSTAYKSVAIGSNCASADTSGVAVGSTTFVQSGAPYSLALGPFSSTFADYTAALGYSAKARVDHTANIGGFIILRKDDGEPAGVHPWCFGGTQLIVLSKEIDLESAATQLITFPTGCKFWLDEAFIIATSISGLVTQPTIQFGINGNNTKYLGSTVTTLLTAAGKRERFSATGSDGETTINATVAVAASGTTVLGRFGWRGILIEDE